MEPAEVIQTLEMAGSLQSTLELYYKKAPDEDPIEREVEPYYFTDGREDVLLRAYQRRPEEGWRFFMLHRIHRLRVTGNSFWPRARVELQSGEMFGGRARMLGAVDPDYGQEIEVKVYGEKGKAIRAYRRKVASALADMSISLEESAELSEFRLKNGLDDQITRGVHYKLFAQCLNGIVRDGVVTNEELTEAKQLNELLKMCGMGILE